MSSADSAQEPVRVLLVGMMGSGKSTIGHVLAERLGGRLLDNDEILRKEQGGGPGAVFDHIGADKLHDVEASLLRERLAEKPTGPEVVDVPASAVLEPDLRELLRRTGQVVWLRATADTLVARIGNHLSGRPEFQEDMPAWIRKEAAARASLYADVANVTVDVDDLEPWQAAQRALDGLGLGVFGWLPGAYQGVVVDLDGLLVDTEVIWEEAKRRLYAARGLPFSIEDHRAVLGTSEDYTVKVFAKRFGARDDEHPQILAEYIGHATAQFEEGVPTRPGARELLASIRGRVPLGLASNTRRELVEMVLQRANLGPFDAITTGDEATPKPAPGLYREACRRLGIDPARSCAVEDSPIGVRGAQSAGLSCIAVPSDPDNVPVEADRIVGSLLDLLEPATN
jgi:HAD superfamily hydrolase (TIGR01509 family)